jgi:hypothetical protein
MDTVKGEPKMANIEMAAAHAEPEITPEMIFAGCVEFQRWDKRFEGLEDAMRRVWVAMWGARNAAPDPSLRQPALGGEAPRESPRYG